MRDPRHDLLFTPVQIGPVRTRNRFYQVPHCNGMGHVHPQALAAMRGVKAEGGWGVVCTEEVEISPHSEIAPWHEGRLWDDADVPPLALMAEACHAHGALAGIELMFNGHATPNRYSREIPLAPSHLPVRLFDPIQAREMSRRDIADVRRWHRAAALRAKHAGFDLVYCYAGHDLALAMHFISRRTNRRSDEYGGSIENRTRFLRELIEDTKDAVGDRCGVVVRFAVDQLLGSEGVPGIAAEAEGREVIDCLAELPDLWDVNLADWGNDSVTARFADEGFQERHIAFVKQLTSKPVVGVGRYTSPDAMVSAIRRGVMDLIGAARPSIADPFLPQKIEQGRSDEIRECIGCNICVSGDQVSVPLRCTQNPTMGEEWRRGWHPERIPPAAGASRVLVVGAGPAGLEAARALGQRGYDVALADAEGAAGGRLLHESALPGLASWRRVVDHRLQALRRMPNAQIYLQSRLDAEAALAFGAQHILTATGSTWRRDGLGRQHRRALLDTPHPGVFCPDDVFAGAVLDSPVLVYDDDHYVMAALLAERLSRAGHVVHYATPSTMVSEWTAMTLEQPRIQALLMQLGVHLHLASRIDRIDDEGGALVVALSSIYTATRVPLACRSLLLVTMRDPADELHRALLARESDWAAAGVKTVRAIGDSLAPGTVAAAVWSGHRAARELEAAGCEPDAVPFRREHIRLQD